ncbi:phage portal protein [Paludicola sp. MB14-C6]|uniref:phage portal protein n=1 Tax=Paludihabitans sp. MB14-C6 TaxID=3070656 RepID=UPI0027DB6550|nr:phage portal protein [Paludicola sp. MB14-C6]WMJ23464.1 phage portal protein [Paludicola sp. MB14-C6]
MNFMQNMMYHIFPKYRAKINSSIIRGERPIYTDFGNDVYLSDVVRQAFKAIALESSKISLKSVIETENPRKITVQNDSITRLFRYKPNPLMTTQEFFYRVAWLRKKNLNVFIYPKYNIVDGKKEFTGFYPLDPTGVTFFTDGTEISIEFSFANGDKYELPYNDIIHLRDEYAMNELVGGNSDGLPENREILKTVSILDKVMQGLPKAITASLEMKGVYNVKTAIDREKLNSDRDKFEEDLNKSSAGIVAIGYEGDFTPININPQLIPKDIVVWLEEKILKNYGVSMAIVSGDFTETQSSAFYQKCIEDFIIQSEQAFSYCCFDDEQQNEGKKIKIYDRLVQHLSMETRLKISELYVPTGYIDEDEARELIGYEPKGRSRTVVSLNYVDIAIANEYQLNSMRNNRGRRNENVNGSGK